MRIILAIIIATFCLGATSLEPVQAGTKKQKAERLVRQAAESLRYFSEESGFTGLWDTADDAQAMVVIPDSYRGGFIFGGSGGNAVMIAKNSDGSWSGPTFMTIGSFSFGLQAGGEVSETVLLAMTNRGKERLLSSSVKLGGDISIAAGPVGVGAKAKTADILAFSRSRGLYGGLSLEGSVLKTRANWNRAYYDNENVTPTDVVFRGVQDNPTSLVLREQAYILANRSQANRGVANIGSTSTAPTSSSYSQGGPAPLSQQPIPVLQPIDEPSRRYEDDAVYGAPLTEPVRDPR